MNNSIYKAAKKFYNAVKGKIDFVNAEKFISDMGYSVVFFNTPEGDAEILRYGKADEASENDAFTHCGTAHIIFINGNVSCKDKLYLLLHEIGHILLGHIGDGKLYVKEKNLLEMEANAFVYEVLHYKPNFNIVVVTTAILLVCCSCIGMYMHKPTNNIATPSTVTFIPQTTVTATVAPTQSPTESPAQLKNPMDIVYVTRTGHKYHRADCQYTRDKDCTTLTREEAQKNYAPCSVCKP